MTTRTKKVNNGASITNLNFELGTPSIFLAPQMLFLNVYRLDDSGLGFYHTGLVFEGHEYTFCQDTGIYCHRPRDCSWATFLGVKRLGVSGVTRKAFHKMLAGIPVGKYFITSG